MNSFTKQLRAGQGAFSRENLEAADLIEVPADQVEETLADPVVVEVAEEVPAEIVQIEEGADAIEEVQADADTLENTAQILEDAIAAQPEAAEPGEGDAATAADADAGAAAAAADTAEEVAEVAAELVEDVEPAAAEIADAAIESFSRKYGMARPAKLSKESFDSAAARVATYRSLSKEAFEKADELRKRASEGIKKLIAWFKELIASVFDKRVRLEKRISVLTAQANAISGAPKADAKIKVGGWGAVVGDAVVADPTDALRGLVFLVNELGGIGKLVAAGTGAIADTAEVDVNPKKIGGVVLKFSVEGGKVKVTKEQAGKADPVEVAPLNQVQIKNVLRDAHKAVKTLVAAEENFKALVKGMDSIYTQVKTGVKEDSPKYYQARGANAAVQNYHALARVSATVSSIALATVGAALTTAEKSIKAYQAPAAAPAAAAAA